MQAITKSRDPNTEHRRQGRRPDQAGGDYLRVSHPAQVRTDYDPDGLVDPRPAGGSH